ncbi:MULTISPECIES: methyl-accepting chemotaxis protein [Marinobacter]|uniref:methyl-accepting chemotaxis protein n=1 Tax=Marinobacter TaxID=2742 RepID=UPI001D0654A9|nr:methyl-accepting chemotaxis protein [Marinobacter sp. CA1]MCG8517828.1 methyl-accepting chemotaxis protein [Pseudomonadales bacterium]MCK7565485.1 methyl-accepting chemotaxis protein [Marinobacter xestospongiae]UDL06372.1 methyl-accepting chemotaxis protein [Marinobacter sp. CA1]
MLNRLTIRYRLLISYALPVIAVIAVTIYGMTSFTRVEQGVLSLYDDRIVPLKQLKNISDSYAVLIIDAVNKANAGRMTASEAANGIRQAQQTIEDQWGRYSETRLTEEEARLVRQVETDFQRADRAIADALTALSRTSGNAEGQLDAIDGPLYDAIDPVTSRIEELMQVQLRASEVIRDDTVELHDRVVLIYSVTCIGLIVVLLVVGMLIGRSISGPIGNLRAMINRIAENSDLSLRLQSVGTDEVAATSDSFNNMLDQMESLVRRLSGATAEVASAAEEMSAVSNQTQQSIDLQAEQTDQVATAMNQMSAASQDVARSASEAQAAATNADQLASEGRNKGNDNRERLQKLSTEVASISETIRGLADQSQSIGRVIQVINDIAEQTNLLALNAAIEAARAGEQGRGFAVVADEVRSLARRTQDSTEEIESLVTALQGESDRAVAAMESGQRDVEASRDQVVEVADILERISGAIEHITGMGAQIASASEEQSVAADQVNANLTQIVDTAEQTRTGAGHTAQGSEDLARLAAELQSLVSEFRISGAR